LVDKTPAELDPGTPSDTSIVHASENGVSTNSKGHDERNISRLQGTAPLYSSAKTYNVNDLVTESGTVFRNITQITIPEVFTAAKWDSISDGPQNFAMGYHSDKNWKITTRYGAMFTNKSDEQVEAEAQSVAGFAYQVKTITVFLSTNVNAVSGSTISLKRNSSAIAATTITIPSLTTGVFIVSGLTEQFSSSDEMHEEHIIGAGGSDNDLKNTSYMLECTQP